MKHDLARIREQLNVSQAKLAALLKTSQASVARVELGKGSAKQTKLVRDFLTRFAAGAAIEQPEPSLLDDAAELVTLEPEALRAQTFAAEQRLSR